jgi:hypothetical protein
MHLRFFPRSARTLTRMDPRNKTRQEFLTQDFDEGNCGVRSGILSDPGCFRRFGLLWFFGNRRGIAINSLRQLSKQYVG